MKKKNTFKTTDQKMADELRRFKAYNNIMDLLLVAAIVLLIFALALLLGN